tara:strand:- start:175 stop:435 length:261 start_codon:yes stop_codon:yes gene_type:complete
MPMIRPHDRQLPSDLPQFGGRSCVLCVVRVEIFTSPNCGGVRRLLAAIQDPDSIERVLRAMGLPFDAPELAVARAPPHGGGGWLGA